MCANPNTHTGRSDHGRQARKMLAHSKEKPCLEEGSGYSSNSEPLGPKYTEASKLFHFLKPTG
jgi:hypothetical protein